MTPTFRTLALGVAAIAVAVFGAASVASYRPNDLTDRARALTALKAALAALDNDALDSSARLVAYRDGLDHADALLREAIRSNPMDTASIERLATVRWESGVLSGSPDSEPVSSLIDVAAARAPRVSEIQADLGELLYRMGRVEDARSYMARAVALSPSMTNRVVATMLDAGVPPERILTSLPPTVELMIALRGSFAQAGDWSEWLTAAERLLPEHPRTLMVSYADACLASSAPDRLLARMGQVGAFADSGDEAERQIAIGRAHLERKDMALAAEAAAAAQALSPADPRLLELVGQVAFLAGDSAKAEQAFRDALGAVARSGIEQIDRARLYRERGQALEHLGRVEEAFDEYRRALNLTPEDPWLRLRFAATASREASAGVR
jgi:tetratricopeptide (TPR) repeat protein